MVNKEAILELADFIEKSDYEFDMSVPHADMSDESTHPACGSAGCIGGFAAVLWPEVRYVRTVPYFYTWDRSALRAKLGLTIEQHSALCYLEDRPDLYYDDVHKELAVQTLRNLAETGEVFYNAGKRAKP